jgi:hypothetical protein
MISPYEHGRNAAQHGKQFKPVRSTAVLRNGTDGVMVIVMSCHPQTLPAGLPLWSRLMLEFFFSTAFLGTVALLVVWAVK